MPPTAGPPITKAEYERIAAFRYALRRFLRFSETQARAHGLTPQQHQILLSIKGTPGREWTNATDLAERMQLRHNAIVQLVNRAERLNLVRRAPDPEDARQVRISLTPKGEEVLARLTAIHREELGRMRDELLPPVG